MFDRVLMVGMGLIGGSMAVDMHRLGCARTIVGVDPDPAAEHLKVQGYVQQVYTHPAQVQGTYDLIILATPPSQLGASMREVAPFAASGALVMDVASVKEYAIEQVRAHLPAGVHFIPAHPIAGSASHGPHAAQSGLFENALVVLCPDENSDETALGKVIALWEQLGGGCDVMLPQQHDRIYAYVSHLAHLVAFAVAPVYAAQMQTLDPSLRPFLRLSGSSPALWCDIAMANAVALSDALEHLLHLLSHLKTELEQGVTLGKHSTPSPQSLLTLLPRIIASAVVSSISLAERKYALNMQPYAGAGLRDMLSVLVASPEADVEAISQAHEQIAELLASAEQQIRAMCVALRREAVSLLLLLQQGKSAWDAMVV